MKKIFMTLLIMVVSLLSSCASNEKIDRYYPYSYKNDNEGYSEMKIDKNIYRVSYHGASTVLADEAEELTLLRSAELTLKNGFTHFSIMNGVSRSDGSVSTGGGIGGAIGGIAGSIGVGLGASSSSSLSSTTNTIILYHGKPNESSNLIYDAKFLMEQMGKKYLIKEEKDRKKIQRSMMNF